MSVLDPSLGPSPAGSISGDTLDKRRRPGRADRRAGRDAAPSRAHADSSRASGTGRRREVPLHQRLQRHLRHHRARACFSALSPISRASSSAVRWPRHCCRGRELAAGGVFHPQEPHGPAEHRPAARLRGRGLRCGGGGLRCPTDNLGRLLRFTRAGRLSSPAWSRPEQLRFTTGGSAYRSRSLPAWRRSSPRIVGLFFALAPGLRRQGRHARCCCCAALPSSRSPCVSTSAIPSGRRGAPTSPSGCICWRRPSSFIRSSAA